MNLLPEWVKARTLSLSVRMCEMPKFVRSKANTFCPGFLGSSTYPSTLKNAASSVQRITEGVVRPPPRAPRHPGLAVWKVGGHWLRQYHVSTRRGGVVRTAALKRLCGTPPMS